MRVLISQNCWFRLSREATLRARELGAEWASKEHMPLVDEPGHYAYGDESETRHEEDIGYSLSSLVPRHDPVLLQVFDELGPERMTGLSFEIDGGMEVALVPDDVTYFIGSYIAEWVAEAHRTWSSQGEQSGGSPVFTKDSKFSPLKP